MVVLPWILGGPGPQSSSAQEPVSGQEPGADNTKVFVSRITPIGGATPPVLSVAKQEPKAPVRTGISGSNPPQTTDSRPAAPAADKAPEPKPAATTTAPAPEPKTQTAKATPALTRGWVVRIGTFSQIENANRVQATLREKGFRPSSGKIKTNKGVATRVWVGPYAKRVEAARVRARIERVTGEKGLITPYP